MFYHSRELRYVVHGKVEPPPIETLDEYWLARYEWLGRHCGYWPQVWLSRSRSQITGIRNRRPAKKWQRDQVLFGFDYARGYPVDYDAWEDLLVLFGSATNADELDSQIELGLIDRVTDGEPEAGSLEATWQETQSVRQVLDRHLFVENDQVVVPSLNLKSAKEIICRSERQKQTLRRIGFIEDRIRILNMARDQWP